MGGPTSSYATAGIALRVIGVLKPPHHDKVETPTRRKPHQCCLRNWLTKKNESGDCCRQAKEGEEDQPRERGVWQDTDCWNLESRGAQAKLENKDCACWVHDCDTGNNRKLGWGERSWKCRDRRATEKEE